MRRTGSQRRSGGSFSTSRGRGRWIRDDGDRVIGREVLRDRRADFLGRGRAIAIEIPGDLVRITEELVVLLQRVRAVVEAFEPIDRTRFVARDHALELFIREV